MYKLFFIAWNNIKKQKNEPDTRPGNQCTCPYECWYRDYCSGERTDTVTQEQIRMTIPGE